MIMLSISLVTSTSVDTEYLRLNFLRHYNLISNHSFKPLLSLHHQGPSIRVSSGTSHQHCRHTHNGTFMKSSLPRPCMAPLGPAPGSRQTPTPTSAQCLETNTNGPQPAPISSTPTPKRSHLPTSLLEPPGTKSSAKPQSSLIHLAASADASYPSQQWIHP